MKLKHIFQPTFLAVAILALASCGNKSAVSTSNDVYMGDSTLQAVPLQEQIIAMTDSGRLQIVPVYGSYFIRDGRNFSCDGSFAVKNSDGEYITFDDDTDYTNYCSTLCFIVKVFREYAAENDIDYFKSYPLSEIKRASALRYKVISSVIAYFQGKKDSIDDARLLSIIENFYNTLKPQSWVFEPFRQRQNDVSYRFYSTDFSPALNAIKHSLYVERNQDKENSAVINSNGDELPEDALVFMTF